MRICPPLPTEALALVRKVLFAGSSSLLLALTATPVRAAIFTVAYSGTVENAPAPTDDARSKLATVGDRILGRYSFDDASPDVILSRFLFVPPTVTGGLDPVDVSFSEDTYRTIVPSTPADASNADRDRDFVNNFLVGSSAADINSLTVSQSMFAGKGQGSSRVLSVNDRAFSFDLNSTFERPPISYTYSGTIDSFQSVDNVTPDIRTSPIIPTNQATQPTVPPVVTSPTEPSIPPVVVPPVVVPPTPSMPTNPSEPTSVPEPATLLGLFAVGLGLRLRRDRSKNLRKQTT